MITNPNSSLLIAYPHLCYKLGTIPANEIAYASPQSWKSQVTPLPQASWNLHIIAVWNTAARLHLNKHNPSWLQDLACDIPEANWHVNNNASHTVCDAETVPASGLKKFEKLHSGKMQTLVIWSHRPTLGDVAPLSHHSNWDSHLKFLTGNFGPTRTVAAISKEIKQILGQRSITPARATLTWLNQMVLV